MTCMLLAPSLLLWVAWCISLARVTPLASHHIVRFPMYFLQPGCLVLLAFTLLGTGTFNPANWTLSVAETFFGGVLWLAIMPWLVSWTGMSPRDDLAERNNVAVAWVVAGMLLGLTLAYGTLAARLPPDSEWGAFAAIVLGGVCVSALFLFWGPLETAGSLSESITIDRDLGTALRLSAFFIALGLCLGQTLPILFRLWPRALFQPPWYKAVGATLALIVLMTVALRVEVQRRGKVRPLSMPTRNDIALSLGYLSGAALCALLVR